MTQRVKFSLQVLGDLEFAEITEELSKMIAKDPSGAKVTDKIDHFIELTERISQGLEEELREF